jgi:multicomponent Na+:H+ antiporter subunit F
MLVLSLLGFAGAVSIARFVAERDLALRWRDSDRPDQGQQ